MLAMALVSWWYTTAWSGLVRRIEQQLTGVLNFFSVGLLFRTLFDPFRQIAAGQSQGNINLQFKAWADRAFSRCVGFVVRSIFIIVGGFSTVFMTLVGGIQLVVWPCIPLLPVIAVLGLIMGWKL